MNALDLTIPPLPDIGQIVQYPGGTITRIGQHMFSLRPENGKNCAVGATAHSPETAWIAAQNVLRRQVGLPELMRPCSLCKAHPRANARTTYCTACLRARSEAHRRKVGIAPKVKKPRPDGRTPKPPRQAPDIWHSSAITAAIRRANDLIAERGGEYRPVNTDPDYLAACRIRLKELQEGQPE